MKVARRLLLTPAVARAVEQWPRFMFNYAFGRVPRTGYRMRNGPVLHIARGVDHVPIIEVFCRSDYGTIAPGSVVVDAGANIGTFALYAASVPRTRVYAYEPLPKFFRLMQDNVHRNGLDTAVTCCNQAIAADAHTRDLHLGNPQASFPTLLAPPTSGGASIRVPCTTLEAVIADHGLARIDVLKMDCEGAEYEILYNAPRHVLAAIREIRMEYHNIDRGQHNVEALAAFFGRQGYDVTLRQATSPANGNLWARRDD